MDNDISAQTKHHVRPARHYVCGCPKVLGRPKACPIHHQLTETDDTWVSGKDLAMIGIAELVRLRTGRGREVR